MQVNQSSRQIHDGTWREPLISHEPGRLALDWIVALCIAQGLALIGQLP
jgi:hypothetical protein